MASYVPQFPMLIISMDMMICTNMLICIHADLHYFVASYVPQFPMLIISMDMMIRRLIIKLLCISDFCANQHVRANQRFRLV